MATKIIIDNNKIVFTGHAEDTETCRTLTAICDALAVNENFETVKYENGYAEFNRVGGGDTMMFEALQKQLEELAAYVKTIKSCECDMQKALADYPTKTDVSKTYETIEAHKASVSLLEDAIDKINSTFGDVDTSKGTVGEQLTNLNVLIIESYNALVERVTALETKTEYKLPYTASELVEKLSTLKEE